MELLEVFKNLDAPAVLLVLSYFINKADKKLTIKEKELTDLNNYIRTSDKENIKMLGEFSKFMEVLISNVDSIKGDISKDIHYSAEMVKNQIDVLKLTIENKNARGNK